MSVSGMADVPRQVTESSLADMRQNLEAEMNSLCKICNMEFAACIKLQEQLLSGQTSVKRRRADKMKGKRRKRKAGRPDNELEKGLSEGDEGRNGMVEDDEMAEGEKGVVAEGKCVCVELDWISGEQETDYLHQLLQYLQNRMSMPTVDFH